MLAVAQELGEQAGIGWALCGLARVAEHLNERVHQCVCLEQSLAHFAVIEHKLGVMSALDGLASLAASQGQGRQAATLLGASDGLRAVMVDDMRSPAQHATYQQTKATASAQLGDEGWAIAWAIGQALTVKQVAAYALEEAQVASAITLGSERGPTAATMPSKTGTTEPNTMGPGPTQAPTAAKLKPPSSFSRLRDSTSTAE